MSDGYGYAGPHGYEQPGGAGYIIYMDPGPRVMSSLEVMVMGPRVMSSLVVLHPHSNAGTNTLLVHLE